MVNGKKYIIALIVLISLVGIPLIVYFVQQKNAANIIESKMNLALPTSSKIIKFDYNSWSGELNAKIQISERDVESLKKELLEDFGEEYDFKNRGHIPNINNVVTWWDMDKNNVEVCYEALVGGKKYLIFPSHKTHEIWVFIVKQNEGNYYLYISYI